jgi:flagellar biosynthesis protein FlhG
MTRIVALTGGRDDVGTTTIAVRLAAQLAASGRRVCLLALVNAAAATTLLDAPVAGTLSDYLSSGRTTPAGLATTVPQGFDLVAGGQGSNWLRDLSAEQLVTLSDGLQELQGYDFILIDAGVGSDQNQLAFSLASPELLLVITPEAESRSAAYALLKLLYAEQYGGFISVLVNKSGTHATGRHAYDKFREIASFYLDMQLPLAGLIGVEGMLSQPHASAAATTGTPSADIHKLVEHLLAQDDPVLQCDIASFCGQLLLAAGAIAAVDIEPQAKPVFAAPRPDDDLHAQLALLSGQVDELISEVERLRHEDSAAATSAAVVPAQPAAADSERCSVAGISAIASRSERVTVGGETFPIYHMRTASGRWQRFACQSIDDDLTEPEPHSRSS